MSDYPKELIAKLDATAAKEAWPLVGFILLTMAVSAVLLYIVGEIANSL